MLKTSDRSLASLGRRRAGIAPAILVIALIIVLAVAAAAVYYVSAARGPSAASSTSATTSARSSSTGPVASTSSSGGSGAISTYSVTFNYSEPAGPGGERVLSNNTVQTYSSVEVGTGSFTFFIAASNSSGHGVGHGTLVVTTAGFCSGRTTVPYTFTIPDATTLLGNITVFIGDAAPGNFTVPLTCTGPMAGVSTATNNPAPFLATYPNELSVAAVPSTVNQHLTGNIDYYFSIVKTN